MGETLVYHRPVKRHAWRACPGFVTQQLRTNQVQQERSPARVQRESQKEKRVATTFERVRGIVAERLGVDEDTITMESDFVGDLNADSLDLVEVIMALEQEFGTEIKDEDAESIRTVGDAVNFIEERS